MKRLRPALYLLLAMGLFGCDNASPTLTEPDPDTPPDDSPEAVMRPLIDMTADQAIKAASTLTFRIPRRPPIMRRAWPRP